MSFLLAAPRDTVQNGAAYKRGALDVSAFDELILPADAVVRRGGQPGRAQFFTELVMSFVGWPPEPMDIRVVHAYAGLCYRVQGSRLALATFGEWGPTMDGGIGFAVHCVLPDSLAFTTRPDLAGAQSMAQGANHRGGENWWYGPRSPAPEWTVLPLELDPEMTVRQSDPGAQRADRLKGAGEEARRRVGGALVALNRAVVEAMGPGCTREHIEEAIANLRHELAQALGEDGLPAEELLWQLREAEQTHEAGPGRMSLIQVQGYMTYEWLAKEAGWLLTELKDYLS